MLAGSLFTRLLVFVGGRELSRVPCGKVVGERQEHLSQLYERRVVRKARVIVDDNSHVLAKCYEILPSSKLFRVPKFNIVRTKQYQISTCSQYHF